jgi:hypothetical protein
MLQVLVAISRKFLLQKKERHGAMQNKKKKKEKMDTKVSKILKTMGT